MFWNAGAMVKAVMLLLVGFSLVSWTIIFSKGLLYRRCIRETDRFLEAFWHSKDLAEAYRFATEESESPEAAVFEMGYKELQKLNHALVPQVRGEETVENRLASMENLKRVLRKAQQQELSRLGGTLAFLATTGSSTPFIGLFGTVWGIMTSFHEIGMRGSASLTVVAPGISEALVATAAGLAVAIPAVIFYNYFSNQLMELEGAMQNFSSDFLNLVERDLITRKI
ncbi:MAG: protein TolQ [Desulfobacterales bacterium CG2_30_60_27]|nr:MAG: protein TolQ [Desulfobacterales bacterium CG2_30_60_27]